MYARSINDVDACLRRVDSTRSWTLGRDCSGREKAGFGRWAGSGLLLRSQCWCCGDVRDGLRLEVLPSWHIGIIEAVTCL